MLTSLLPTTPANDTTPALDSEAVTRHRGSLCDTVRTSADLAAALRADVKRAMKLGGLPQMKVSITAKSYSMGQSVTVSIQAAPFGVLNPERVRHDAATDYAPCAFDRLTPRAAQIQARIETMAAEYTRSETHSQSDYCNANCFVTVKYDSDLTNAERAAILAQSTTGA